MLLRFYSAIQACYLRRPRHHPRLKPPPPALDPMLEAPRLLLPRALDPLYPREPPPKASRFPPPLRERSRPPIRSAPPPLALFPTPAPPRLPMPAPPPRLLSVTPTRAPANVTMDSPKCRLVRGQKCRESPPQIGRLHPFFSTSRDHSHFLRGPFRLSEQRRWVFKAH